MRTPCAACYQPGRPPSPHCHECGDLGYIERAELPEECTKSCPIGYDAMVSGWECARCGLSGPWPPPGVGN